MNRTKPLVICCFIFPLRKHRYLTSPVENARMHEDRRWNLPVPATDNVMWSSDADISRSTFLRLPPSGCPRSLTKYNLNARPLHCADVLAVEPSPEGLYHDKICFDRHDGRPHGRRQSGHLVSRRVGP